MKFLEMSNLGRWVNLQLVKKLDCGNWFHVTVATTPRGYKYEIQSFTSSPAQHVSAELLLVVVETCRSLTITVYLSVSMRRSSRLLLVGYA
jgi:hypothetical protein